MKLNSIKDLLSLRDLINPSNVSIEITFWGTRILKLKTPQDNIKINSIAKKVFDSQLTFKKLNFQERKAGLEIYEYLNRYYKESDTCLSGKCFFTKIFVQFRECFGLPTSFACTPRSRIEHGFDADMFVKFPHDSIKISSSERLELIRIYENSSYYC